MKSWDILLLDISGSMFDNKIHLIKGFNNLLNEQKLENSKNYFTTFLFNEDISIFKEGLFQDIEKICDKDIIVRGKTALYDSVGYVYENIIKNDDYKKITLTIITDGIENCSKKYTPDILNFKKKIIDSLFDLKIVFIGTDISCLSDKNLSQQGFQNVNCMGNIETALKIASRTMSNSRNNVNVNVNSNSNVNVDLDIDVFLEKSCVTPLVIKRSLSSSENNERIKLKRCNSYC